MKQKSRLAGRPRLASGQDTSEVNVRLPEYLHDAACKIALYEGISVSAVLRTALRAYLATQGFVSVNTSS